MRETTDMDGIRSLAQTFLLLEPDKTEYAPAVVKHPFTDCGIVALQKPDGEMVMADIMKDQDVRKQWRGVISGQINRAENWHAIYLMLTKSYYFAFLKYARPYLSREDFSDILAYAWTGVEAPNQDPNFGQSGLLSLFKSADPKKLMDDGEYQRFRALDEEVIVYRGVTPYNADSIRSMSWTLDRNVAEWFSKRFWQEGCVYQAKINRDHILAVFNRRRESEVIVDPKYLFDISTVHEEVQTVTQDISLG